MIKNLIPLSCLKSNSFTIRIVSTTSSIPSPQETGIVKHRGFDICILRNQCHTFILSFFSSSKIFVLSTKQISDKVYNLPTKKTPNFHVKSDFCPQAVYVACDIYEVWFVLSIFSIIKPILNVKHWKSNCVNQSWKLQMSIANVFHRKTTATSKIVGSVHQNYKIWHTKNYKLVLWMV